MGFYNKWADYSKVDSNAIFDSYWNDIGKHCFKIFEDDYSKQKVLINSIISKLSKENDFSKYIELIYENVFEDDTENYDGDDDIIYSIEYLQLSYSFYKKYNLLLLPIEFEIFIMIMTIHGFINNDNYIISKFYLLDGGEYNFDYFFIWIHFKYKNNDGEYIEELWPIFWTPDEIFGVEICKILNNILKDDINYFKLEIDEYEKICGPDGEYFHKVIKSFNNLKYKNNITKFDNDYNFYTSFFDSELYKNLDKE